MTLLEVTYELQKALSTQQLRALGGFGNTYGLRRFRVSADKLRLTFEYDGSRLKEPEVAHVLRRVGIAVLRQAEVR